VPLGERVVQSMVAAFQALPRPGSPEEYELRRQRAREEADQVMAYYERREKKQRDVPVAMTASPTGSTCSRAVIGRLAGYSSFMRLSQYRSLTD
jgi:hypothetical protein